MAVSEAQDAKRYNTGKLRYDLIPKEALEKLAEVYTKGAHKYTAYRDEEGNEVLGKDIPFEDLAHRKFEIIENGDDNWRLGQDWTKSMASVQRHIELWRAGEDIDPDPSMKTYHLANAAWGLFSLLTYYDTHPEKDDRKHRLELFNKKKIGLDIDGVLAEFSGHYLSYFKDELPHTDPANHWNDSRFRDEERWSRVESNEEFWASIPKIIDPSEMKFEPHCYITARSIPTEWTQRWLNDNGFPFAPLYVVGRGESKVKIAKESGIDLFIDDYFGNFTELNRAGVLTYLMSRSHNMKYDVGHLRIDNLNDLKNV